VVLFLLWQHTVKGKYKEDKENFSDTSNRTRTKKEQVQILIQNKNKATSKVQIQSNNNTFVQGVRYCSVVDPDPELLGHVGLGSGSENRSDLFDIGCNLNNAEKKVLRIWDVYPGYKKNPKAAKMFMKKMDPDLEPYLNPEP
jgi:hypothetical protein